MCAWLYVMQLGSALHAPGLIVLPVILGRQDS